MLFRALDAHASMESGLQLATSPDSRARAGSHARQRAGCSWGERNLLATCTSASASAAVCQNLMRHCPRPQIRPMIFSRVLSCRWLGRARCCEPFVVCSHWSQQPVQVCPSLRRSQQPWKEGAAAACASA